MHAAGILMRARGDRLSVASRAPLTDRQRAWIRAHKVELLRLLADAVPTPAELNDEHPQVTEERATARKLDGSESKPIGSRSMATPSIAWRIFHAEKRHILP